VFGTFTLGRVLGVPIRVHGLVLLLLAGLLVSSALRHQPIVLPLAALLVALLAHEFGHALVARRLGVHVYDVVLWPLGGMARMSEVPEDARVEAQIAAAGPLVNLALASLALAALGLGFPGTTLGAPIGPGSLGPAETCVVFIWMNLLLGLGNLLPAFPMDGGRLLRAGLVATGRDWLAATELAVRVGRWIACGMLVLGLMHSLVLVLVALFLLLMGTRELWTVRLRHAAGGLFGGLRRAGAGEDRGGPARGPSAVSGGNPEGPASFDTPPPLRPRASPSPQSGSGGFSDEDIERLESYRGRLRRGRDED